VRLVDYTDDDLGFSIRIETDPRVMTELGGPRTVEAIERVHPKRVAQNRDDGIWQKIVTDEDEDAGQIGVWCSEHDGEEIWEVGWMLLADFHGRGLGSAALAELIERMRAAGVYDVVHAFPGVTNGPSNGLCRKFGFELLGELELDFRGATLRANHWRLALG